MKLEIEWAKKSDAEPLAAIAARAFPNSSCGPKVFQAVSDFAEETMFEAHSVFSEYRTGRLDGRIVGMCGLYRLRWVGDQVRYLGWFFVDPAMQGNGFGKELLSDSIAMCREKQIRWLMVETDDGATAAIGLYGSFGFKQFGAVPEYWPDREGLVLMGLRP